MCVKLTQRKKGFPAWACRLMKSAERAAMSSSIVSIRFFVSGPVSWTVCLPTLPKRGSTVASSVSVALQSNTQRTEPFAKVRKILRVRVIGQLRLLLGVQVVQVAEELVETVDRRQIFIAVAEMVLADLRGRISQWLQELGDGRVFLVETNRSGRQTDFGQPG